MQRAKMREACKVRKMGKLVAVSAVSAGRCRCRKFGTAEFPAVTRQLQPDTPHEYVE